MNLRVENINFNWNSCIMPNTKRHNYPNLTSLGADTISFGAMKKSEFRGIDALVVNKFKAPIEKFNSSKDLQDWSKTQIDELNKKDLKGRQDETTIGREATFKEWSEYVLKENDAYTNTMSLLILDGILKGIKSDNDTEIPPLNKGVLAQTISDIENKLKENPKADVNFNKLYRMNLQNISLGNLETHLDSHETGWVVIPSKEHDPENFEENVDRLKTLSHKNWCTASFNAEPYLSKGDFHVYLKNGKPKLGVRFVGDEIAEIQGEKNNGKIPVKYLDVARKHTKEFKLSDSTRSEFKQAKNAKEKIEKIEKKLKAQGVDFKNCSTRQIFDALGINYQVDPDDGLLTIDEYEQPDSDFTFEDIGINEDKLFKDIKEIKGDADFTDSSITNLGNLQAIGGYADFENSKITNLCNLQTIGGNAYFKNSQITDLGKLQTIGGNADFRYSNLTDLGNLQTIGGYADFENSKITNLGNLQTIGGNAYFKNSQITDLGKLQTIGGNADFRYSNLTDLGNLQTIGGNADFRYSNLTDLGNLQTIGGRIYLKNSNFKIEDFKNVDCKSTKAEATLKELGVDFKTCSTKQLLEAFDIECEVDYKSGLLILNEYKQPSDFTFSELGIDENKLFKDIKKIRGNADFEGSNVTDLGKLQTIGGNANFECSNVTVLGNLQTIGGYANFENSQITDLGKLQTIGGDVYINNSPLKRIQFISIEIGGKIID